MIGDEIVGHLKKGRTGGFAKTVFYFLRADEKGPCTAVVKGKAVNPRSAWRRHASTRH